MCVWSKWFSTATFFSLVSPNIGIYGGNHRGNIIEIFRFTSSENSLSLSLSFFLTRFSKSFSPPSGLRESGGAYTRVRCKVSRNGFGKIDGRCISRLRSIVTTSVAFSNRAR